MSMRRKRRIRRDLGLKRHVMGDDVGIVWREAGDQRRPRGLAHLPADGVQVLEDTFVAVDAACRAFER